MFLNYAFRDLQNVVILALVLIITLMIAIFNVEQQKKTEEGINLGNMTVTAVWQSGDIDVDLWLLGPGEKKGIGYSNRQGVVWNYVRDDLGNGSDLTGLNFENAITRGLPEGEYTINLHLYRTKTEPVPVEVEIAISKRAGLERIKLKTIVLVREGQEVTVINFKIDKDGNIDESSRNSVFKPLRSARQ